MVGRCSRDSVRWLEESYVEARGVRARRDDVYIPETMICENDMYPNRRDVAAETANSS